MQAEYLSINKGGEGQIVEQISEVFPHVGVAVFAQTFIVEAINLGDLTGFVVAAKNGDSLTVAHLECDKQRNCFHRVIAAIDIVTHE